MDLLAALDTIRNAPDESLHIHASQTISTLKEIGKRLQHNLLPSSPSVVDTPPSVESDQSRSPSNSGVLTPIYHHCLDFPRHLTISPSLNHSLVRDSPDLSQQDAPAPRVSSATAWRNHTPTRSTVDFLLDGIKRHAYWLLEAQKLEDDAIISRKRRLGEDVRWDDIERVEGIKARDRESKLRRVLALRSIAQEHEDEQIQLGISPTRLEELCGYVSSPKTSTLNLKANHTVKEPFKTRVLHSGLRHLTIEKTLNARLEACNLPGNCEAISAVLALNIHHFRCLRYDDFSVVLDALQSMRIPTTKGKKTKKETMTEGKPQPLLPLLRDLSEWFKQLQNKYNLYTSRLLEVDPGRKKRPRSNPDCLGQYRTSFTHVVTPEPEDLAIAPSINNTEDEGPAHYRSEAILYASCHPEDHIIQPPPGAPDMEESQPAMADFDIPPDFFDQILAQPVNICASGPEIFGVDDISSRDLQNLLVFTHGD